MKILGLTVYGLVFLVVLSGCGTPNPVVNIDAGDASSVETDWELVWADEFDGEALDRTKWKPEVSCWGGGNDERQCYTDRVENIEVSDGVLRLKAFKGEHTGPKFPEENKGRTNGEQTQEYTSGKVRTRKLAAWTYGRFEARMKLPTGQGTWPAFWMMSDDGSYGGWPLSGEIDILEAVNLGATCVECDGGEGENRSIGALHFGNFPPDNEFLSIKHQLPSGPNAKDNYHVFAVEWSEGQIDWFVDGIKFFTLNSEDWFSGAVSKAENPYAPFDQPFYMMFNLAVGGRLSEGNNDTGFNPDSFPSEMLIDWVRVYQCKDDPLTGRACANGR